VLIKKGFSPYDGMYSGKNFLYLIMCAMLQVLILVTLHWIFEYIDNFISNRQFCILFSLGILFLFSSWDNYEQELDIAPKPFNRIWNGWIFYFFF